MASTESEGKTPSIAVVGSYNVGLTMRVPQFPIPGETVIGEGFAEGPGGKGSNQAIAASRLGAETTFIGRVGTDRYGDDAFDLWEQEGIDTSQVSRDAEAHTGAGFVLVDAEGENEITVAPGANATLSAHHVDDAADVIAESDVLLVQLEIETDPIERVLEVAASNDVEVVLNPAPVRDLDPAVLDQAAYLTPNQNEARSLAGIDPEDEVADRAIAEQLSEQVDGTVVMTVGSDGALLVDEAVTAVDAPTVDPVDTTGAGDAFNGAFAVGLASGMTQTTAAHFACAAGALTVTASEVVPGLPTRDAVEELHSS
ncbi:ribokinase [Natronolimnobius sp. AArcel1]|uniref:ribokinase n=1 Tax=Natronolimnobius sp. AArcel1 TaxID=1679093 RepID=UPI0013EDBC2F|nr:ribokinase [Natronolimnobius sp. AArcel1]NGM70485.1 ribokinase [Natronolimnobius sp. AArcel1]